MYTDSVWPELVLISQLWTLWFLYEFVCAKLSSSIKTGEVSLNAFCNRTGMCIWPDMLCFWIASSKTERFALRLH
ncbi:hypothetical protein RJT34_14192 [Clitoria ternatea]|uniref:Uncharacterized protein n=1 Tax=Clitoria ternatea TaxID=43366 RepID=A0AAN9PMF5_CLITE